MSDMQDRQLERELSQLGQRFADGAPTGMPDGIRAGLSAKRRRNLLRRVAIATAAVLVGAGTAVVYMAASAWTPAPTPGAVTRREPSPSMRVEAELGIGGSAQSIVSMQQAWERTGEADPPVRIRDGETPMTAGDLKLTPRSEGWNDLRR